MSKLMDCQGVINLATKLIDKNPGNLHSPDNYLLHLEDTYKICKEIVETAISSYPELSNYLKEEEVALAGGLHDIGRPLQENQLFHELRGAQYIEQYGLKIGVAESEVDIYRIAQMFRPHYVVAEQFADPDNSDQLNGITTLPDSALLIPRTWQEAIVIYSELSNVNGNRMSVEERIDDVKDRYTNDPKFNSNPAFINAMKTGLDRVFEVCDRVQKLIDGDFEPEEIMRYGFL
ncbi:MAG: hypothetical protein GQ477_02285 [Nanohaloarchaea archaeon]|nr:hypothetical protein [Candidatus Nanohaloarchaea archaeon]